MESTTAPIENILPEPTADSISPSKQEEHQAEANLEKTGSNEDRTEVTNNQDGEEE
jgi:hypothetical protein